MEYNEVFIYDYLGYGIHKSKCRIFIKSVDDEIFIGFNDLGIGTSVTNASEQLATEIVQKYGFDFDKCIFFEWYNNEESLDLIAYTWNKNVASNPSWSPYKYDNPFFL